MENYKLYVGYVERKSIEQCKQILTRAYIFLAIDILIFIAHAAFLSIDMGLGQATAPDVSFLHTVGHLLSLVLIVACMFFQIHLYNTVSTGTDATTLHKQLSAIAHAVVIQEQDVVTKLIYESIHQDMASIDNAVKKAMRYLDIIEYFTCGACCLLFLVPI